MLSRAAAIAAAARHSTFDRFRFAVAAPPLAGSSTSSWLSPGCSSGCDDDVFGGRGRVGRRTIWTTTATTVATATATSDPVVPIIRGRRHRNDPPSIQHRHHRNNQRQQQVRHMGRKSGASAFTKPRPPTPKQRRVYDRKKRRRHHELHEKHSPHGSKRLARDRHSDRLLDIAKSRAAGEFIPVEDDPEFNTYTMGHAMIEDLVGNTSHLTRSETPRVADHGDMYEGCLADVAGTMNRLLLAARRSEMGGEGEDETKSRRGYVVVEERTTPATPPTDEQISLLVRAHRDKFGSPANPVGVARALSHLFDLGLSTSDFGERTYTSLMTCASNPAEARRVLRMMTDHNENCSPDDDSTTAGEKQLLPLSYAYSILVDKYAKEGDFDGARSAVDEMSLAGIRPTLAAYTSLIASCHHAVKSSLVSPRIKSRAADVGWKAWMEMRIIGVDADAMAYGAIIRLFAARGKPEKCIDMIEEMQAFEVLPTTLIFTAALHAVARSHRTSLLFEGGSSRKNRKRERIAAHHGRMAREIVVLAEQAEVDQDDGFVSALILCAAAAGDAATAKAIMLASDVRRKDWLRSIGSEDHLRSLRPPPSMSLGAGVGGGGGGDDATRRLETSLSSIPSTVVPSLDDALDDHRRRHGGLLSASSTDEVGTTTASSPDDDDRRKRRDGDGEALKLRSLLFAFSQSVDPNCPGDLWGVGGPKRNRGYLCERTQHFIKNSRRVPRYHDNSIPGVSGTDVGLSSMTWDEEDPDEVKGGSKALRRKKWLGVRQDGSVGHTMDDIDADLAAMFDVDLDDGGGGTEMEVAGERRLIGGGEEWGGEISHAREEAAAVEEVTYRDAEYRDVLDSTASEATAVFPNGQDGHSTPAGLGFAASSVPDKEEMTRTPQPLSSKEQSGDEMTFQEFRQQLREEFGVDDEFADEADAKELYNVMREEGMLFGNDEADDDSSSLSDDFLQSFDDVPALDDGSYSQSSAEQSHLDATEKRDFNEVGQGNLLDNSDGGELLLPQLRKEDGQVNERNAFGHFAMGTNTSSTRHVTKTLDYADATAMFNDEVTLFNTTSGNVPLAQQHDRQNQQRHDLMSEESVDDALDDEFEREMPPGLPKSRTMKLRQVFQGTLGTPSMLELVPLLRENVPEGIDRTWLQRKNMQNAHFAMKKAEEDELVDVPLLNGMLQVITNGGNIGKALSFHATRFQQRGLAPNSFSDRMVLQMLISNKKLSRALAFKEQVLAHGRVLDLISYGSLVKHYGRRNELGSALMLIRECISVHGFPPAEHSLKNVRLLCRQRGIEKDVAIEDLIGEDPLEWLRHGEKYLKREYSKKGRRGILDVRNKFLKI